MSRKKVFFFEKKLWPVFYILKISPEFIGLLDDKFLALCSELENV